MRTGSGKLVETGSGICQHWFSSVQDYTTGKVLGNIRFCNWNSDWTNYLRHFSMPSVLAVSSPGAQHAVAGAPYRPRIWASHSRRCHSWPPVETYWSKHWWPTLLSPWSQSDSTSFAKTAICDAVWEMGPQVSKQTFVWQRLRIT